MAMKLKAKALRLLLGSRPISITTGDPGHAASHLCLCLPFQDWSRSHTTGLFQGLSVDIYKVFTTMCSN